MTAAVDITTDKRRLIGYFFVPIVDVIQNALEARGTGGNYHFAPTTDAKIGKKSGMHKSEKLTPYIICIF